jgi:hypothetical protein
MAIEEPTVGGHSVGEPYAGLVMPYEFLELSLGELCAMRAHQVPAIIAARRPEVIIAGPRPAAGMRVP